MSKGLFAVLAGMVLALALVVTACGGSDESADDLLASIEDKGVLTVSTDPAYPPQSELNKETGEYEGFDIDVATEIAERMGVDIAWEAPAWETIISGSWNGRWDISVGSMTITPERAEVLHFSAALLLHACRDGGARGQHDDHRAQPISTGKTIGVCGGCTYDLYLQEQAPDRGGRVGRASEDRLCHHRPRDQDVRHGLDRDPGPRARRRPQARRRHLRAADPRGGDRCRLADQDRASDLFYEPLSVAVDRSSQLDPTSLVERISEIIDEMHEDGTMSRAVGEVVRHEPDRRSAQGDGVS